MLTYDFEKRGKMSLYEYLDNCIKNDILSGKSKAGEMCIRDRRLCAGKAQGRFYVLGNSLGSSNT